MSQVAPDHIIKQKLADIARHFDLGAITSNPRRAMGTNQNYFITTTRGQFLLAWTHGPCQCSKLL